MEKTKILETILFESKRCDKWGFNSPYTWGEVQTILIRKGIPEIKPTDILSLGYDEGFQEEDNSLDSNYFIKLEREREETDEELKKRKLSFERDQKRSKELRRTAYLNLKKEFENEQEI